MFGTRVFVIIVGRGGFQQSPASPEIFSLVESESRLGFMISIESKSESRLGYLLQSSPSPSLDSKSPFHSSLSPNLPNACTI